MQRQIPLHSIKRFPSRFTSKCDEVRPRRRQLTSPTRRRWTRRLLPRSHRTTSPTCRRRTTSPNQHCDREALGRPRQLAAAGRDACNWPTAKPLNHLANPPPPDDVSKPALDDLTNPQPPGVTPVTVRPQSHQMKSRAPPPVGHYSLLNFSYCYFVKSSSLSCPPFVFRLHRCNYLQLCMIMTKKMCCVKYHAVDDA